LGNVPARDAALLVGVIGIASVGESRAHRTEKHFPEEGARRQGPVQPLRKGPMGKRGGSAAEPRDRAPRGQMLGPGGAPGTRAGPTATPAPASAMSSPATALSAPAGNRAFGNNQFRPPRPTNRDPSRRAVNARTPQLRQVQRF